jgi:hypothetical protein
MKIKQPSITYYFSNHSNGFLWLKPLNISPFKPNNMKNHIEKIAKNSKLIALFMIVLSVPKSILAQADIATDTTAHIDTGITWENVFGGADEDEDYGKPYLFHFGNGILATYDANCAKQIGLKVGKPFPARGINKVGDFYAATEIEDLTKVKNGELLKGFLGNNDKLYLNADAYEYNPGKPMLDPKVFGNYGIEQGGKPKVFRL